MTLARSHVRVMTLAVSGMLCLVLFSWMRPSNTSVHTGSDCDPLVRAKLPEEMQVERVSIGLREIVEEAPPQEQEQPETTEPASTPEDNHEDKQLQEQEPPKNVANTRASESAGKGQKRGSFPPLTADYRKTLGFTQYARDMAAIGARFFVFDKTRRKLTAEVALDSKEFRPVGILYGLSPRSRELPKEKELDMFLEEAQREYGASQYTILMLVPAWFDTSLVETIGAEVSKQNLNVDDFSRFLGEYRKNGSSFMLKVHSGILTTGERKPLSATIWLGQG